MSKGKCKCPEPGIAEWVMSYADMITILMAFFVVMYSTRPRPTDASKEEAVFKSLRDRFGPHLGTMTGIGPGPYVRVDSLLARIMSRPVRRHGSGKGSTEKEGDLGADAEGAPGENRREKGDNENSGKAGADSPGPNGEFRRMTTSRPGEPLSVGGVILFEEGSDKLSAEQKKQLALAAEEIRGKPHRIEIRGHTSRRPIGKGPDYRDNWDLAYARCRAALNELVTLGINPKLVRLGVAGENEPPAVSDDAVARSHAGRVEVFLLNEVADRPRDGSRKSAVPLKN